MEASGLGTMTSEDADKGIPLRVLRRDSKAVKGAKARSRRTGGPGQWPSRALGLGPHPALPFSLCDFGQIAMTLSPSSGLSVPGEHSLKGGYAFSIILVGERLRDRWPHRADRRSALGRQMSVLGKEKPF